MISDTDKIVSMTEANQNFSKVARMAMEYGDVTILKNNKVGKILLAMIRNLLQDPLLRSLPYSDLFADRVPDR